MELKINNGEIFISGIIIKFESATLVLANEKKDTIVHSFLQHDLSQPEKKGEEERKEMTAEQLVGIMTPNQVIQPTTPQEEKQPIPRKRLRSEFYDKFIELLKEDPKMTRRQFEERTGCPVSTSGNVIYNLVQEGKIIRLGLGLYGLPGSEIKVEKQQETIKKEEEKQSIPTHGLLNVGDEVMLLPEGIDPENDNLDFPMHLLEEKFVIDKIEEGSDLITIKNIHNGNKSLVYPHWVAIVK